MALKLNRRAQAYAHALIMAGQVNTGDTFELTPEVLEQLGENPGRYYLGHEPGLPADEPGRWRHAVGRFDGDDFTVYQAALEAIVDLEAEADDVRHAAEELLGLIDVGAELGDEALEASSDENGTEEISASEGDDGGGGKPPDGDTPAIGGEPGRALRLAGDDLTRALEGRDPNALAQVRADMREKRELVGPDAIRSVFGTNLFSRTYSAKASSVDREKRTAELSFSSEEPYERWGWDIGAYLEVLGHSEGEVRLDRLNAGGALLVNHDTDDQVGVILTAEIGEGPMGRAIVEFSRSTRAEEILVDVEGGIRRNTSVGYLVHSMKLVEEHDDSPDVYRVTDWEALEVSIVAIPADPTVGLGRELELAARATTEKESENMKKKFREFMDTPGDPAGGGEPLDTVAIQTKAKEEARAEELGRMDSIMALAREHKLESLGREHCEKGTSLNDFTQTLLKAIADGAGQPAKPGNGVDEIGLTQKEARSFSFIKALRAVFAREGFEKFSRSDIEQAGFELEASKAVGDLLGQDAKGVLVPMEVLRTPLVDPRDRAIELLIQQRDANVASDPAGGYLVSTSHMGVVPMLHNLCLLLGLGVTPLGGLIGDVAIPRHVSGSTTYWLNEDGEPTESDPVFAQLSLRPHTVGGTTDVTRRLLKQSSRDMEALVREMIMSALAVEIDRVGINGSGHSGEPLGILNTTGIGSVADSGGNGSAPDWDDVVDTFKELVLDNVRMAGMGWITSVQNACKLMKTKMDGTNLPFIMSGFDENGWTKLMGLKCGVTNNVPSNLAVGSGTSLSAMICGYFPDAFLAQWGTIDLTADKSSKVLSGGLRVVGLADVDIGLKRPQSFSAKADCITT